MKRFLLFLIIIPGVTFSQVADHFTDGNFSQNPLWRGDTNHFEINLNHQLHLNFSGSDTSYLSTVNKRAMKTEWSFWIKISFNTSANNYARVYLISDTVDLSGPVNGYYVQFGGTDDSIIISRQKNNEHKRVLSFHNYVTSQTSNILRIKIRRGIDGYWETFLDTVGGTNYIRDHSFTDTTFRTGNYFGVFCRYTSSNSKKFYFDDIYVGSMINDSTPPRLISCRVADSVHIQAIFSESPEYQGLVDPQHYILLNKGIRPQSITVDPIQSTWIQLQFSLPLEEGIFDTLKITGIADLSGNLISDTLVPVCYYPPRAYDILINEIMFDPEPPNALPPQEYIELFNRSDYPINMKDWVLYFGNHQKQLPDITLQTHSYLLLVKDTNLFSAYGPSVPLFSSGSSLSNEGATITIKDREQRIVHFITYSPDWFHGSFKEEGGWSVEMADPLSPCVCEGNWEASTDMAGGTPGKSNSINGKHPDETAPGIDRAFIRDSTILHLVFSEPMDSLSLQTTAFNKRLPDEIIHREIVSLPPSYQYVDLMYDVPFQRNIIYAISFDSTLKDCSGNGIDNIAMVRAAIPDSIRQSEIVINELLFNPQSGGSRFVELFNRSAKVLDLSELILSGKDLIQGGTNSGEPVSTERFLLFPEEYAVISPDIEDICIRYHCWDQKNFIKMKNFPSLNNDTGIVVLARKDNNLVIDKFRYNHEMHYPLLTTEEGVSLERLNPEKSSESPENWHSASETSGFATPGHQNSQQTNDPDNGSQVVLSPEIFSPDNDGKEDVLSIRVNAGEPGYQATIIIFDERGREVKRLINNILISNTEVFYWDGIDDDRNKAPIGFYIVYVEIQKPDGTVKRFKKCAVLGGRF